MDAEEDEGERGDVRDEQTLEGLLVPPAAILESLPDAVVAAERDGRIVLVNALAEELFGYPRDELIGKPVQTLWPIRVRERYTRNMELYFATEHPMRFSTAAWGLRRDGSEFVGEMSWGIVATTGGPFLLAVGRDISERRAAQARLHAVVAMGERAGRRGPRRPRDRGR
jgi:PAS domain S-box-containing protein